MTLGKIGALALAGTAMVAVGPTALAQAQRAQDYDIPSQDLGAALRQVALQSGTPVVAPTELVAGARSPALKGRYLPEEAVALLLRDSQLRIVRVGETLVVRRDGQDGGARQEGPEDEGELVVTGTRIRGQGPVGVAVITLDRKALEQGGFSTTQQLVQSIPQSFNGGANESTSGLLTAAGNGNVARGVGINLRGLGQGSTLLLLDGDRPPLGGFGGTFADISIIPASVVERVEVVPDGSSAIYGFDAVAGVVNVMTRSKFRGAETSARFGTADGDAQEYQFSQLFGTSWSSGHAMIAYEFYRRDNLAAADRDYITEDLRPFGGTDQRGNYASPGTIVAGGVNYAIPAGQNGVGLTAAQLTRGVVNRGDAWFGVDILPEQQRHSVFVSLSQEIATGIRLYARGLATWRRFDQAVRTGVDSRRTVPVSNPFYVDPIGTRQPVGVNYSFTRDLGAERYRGEVRAYGGSAGVEADLGTWRVDLHGTWGRQNERYDYLNRVNSARLALALTDTNPATAYNLFGDGPSTNTATIESIRGYNKSDYGGILWSAILRADGALVRLPAGQVRLAVGGEYREDRYRDGDNFAYTSTLTPVMTAPTPLPAKRTVKSAYAELLIPVFGKDAQIPLFDRLDLSAALRTEEYSDFGRTTNPKFSFSWEPFAALTLRGSYGKSFRAPSFPQLRQDPGSTFYFAYPLPDPQSPTGSSNVMVLRGNDPGLRPERATTWTLGGDLRVGGLRAGLTWFNVDYRDRIASVQTALLSFLTNRNIYAPVLTFNPSPAAIAAYFASPYYTDLGGVPRTAPIAAIADARIKNLSVVKQSGLDMDVAYTLGLGGGEAEIGAVSTYIFNINQQLTTTSRAVDVVDTVGNPVDLHVRARALWSKDGLSVGVFGNYVDGYTNKTTPTPQHVGSWTTFDLNIGYRFQSERGPLKGLRIGLNASNILDEDPPYVSYLVAGLSTGFDAENASPLGRMIALQVTKSW